jgi:hypothetical protein
MAFGRQRGQGVVRFDVVVGLVRLDREPVPLRPALDHHPAGLLDLVDLQAGVCHRKALELGAHRAAVAVAADPGDHQLRRHERGQVARHVERRAAHHLPGGEVVDERLAEYNRGGRARAHASCGTVSLNEARSDNLSNRRARFG